MTEDRGYFYFVAQTGSIADAIGEPVQSNFYTYKLPNAMRQFVLDVSNNARLGSGGLEYSSTFLNLLSRQDSRPKN